MYHRLLSYDQFIRACKNVAEQVVRNGVKYYGILAIAKSGLIPAVIISQLINVRTIKSFQVTHRTNTIISEPPFEIEGRWLVVDDIIYTGETLNLVQKIYPDTDAAICYMQKHWSDINLIGTGNFFFGKLVDNTEEQILFPWEMIQ